MTRGMLFPLLLTTIIVVFGGHRNTMIGSPRLLAVNDTPQRQTAMSRGTAARTGVYSDIGPRQEPSILWRDPLTTTATMDPAVRAGVLYAGDGRGDLVARDSESGRELWRATTGGWTTSAPSVADDLVVIGSDGGGINVSSYTGPALIAYDAATGTERWRVGGAGGIGSPPAIDQGVAYVGGRRQATGYLVAVEIATGAVRWRLPLGRDSPSGAAVLNDTVYVGGRDGTVAAVEAASGTVRWTVPIVGGAVRSPPAASAEIVFVAGDAGTLYALARESGRELWRFTPGASLISAPSVLGSLVAITDGEGTLHVLDSTTGEPLQSIEVGGTKPIAPSATDDTVYVVAGTAISAFDRSGWQDLWRIDTGVRLGTAAIPADGNLFVGGEAVLALGTGREDHD